LFNLWTSINKWKFSCIFVAYFYDFYRILYGIFRYILMLKIYARIIIYNIYGGCACDYGGEASNKTHALECINKILLCIGIEFIHVNIFFCRFQPLKIKIKKKFFIILINLQNFKSIILILSNLRWWWMNGTLLFINI